MFCGNVNDHNKAKQAKNHWLNNIFMILHKNQISLNFYAKTITFNRHSGARSAPEFFEQNALFS